MNYIGQMNELSENVLDGWKNVFFTLIGIEEHAINNPSNVKEMFTLESIIYYYENYKQIHETFHNICFKIIQILTNKQKIDQELTNILKINCTTNF